MQKNSNIESLNQANEDQAGYAGFFNKSEDEKLKENIFRSPIEKLQSFTKMLRRENVLRNAKISHT